MRPGETVFRIDAALGGRAGARARRPARARRGVGIRLQLATRPRRVQSSDFGRRRVHRSRAARSRPASSTLRRAGSRLVRRRRYRRCGVDRAGDHTLSPRIASCRGDATYHASCANAEFLPCSLRAGPSGDQRARADQLRAVFTGGQAPFEMRALAPSANPFQVQLERFCAAVRGEAKLPVTGHDALPSVRALVACYAARRPLRRQRLPLRSSSGNAARFKKVLITGAAGAVGSRLVERFATADRLGQLRCVVRSLRSASRILRYPIELAEADLTDAKAVRRAIEGCDAIVHLAVGDRAAAETRPLVEAARELGIRRFVHMSSAAVYGRKMPVEIEQQQERTPLVDTGEPYADRKRPPSEWCSRRISRRSAASAHGLRPVAALELRAAAAAAAARGAEARPVGLVQPHLRRRPRRRRRPGARSRQRLRAAYFRDRRRPAQVVRVHRRARCNSSTTSRRLSMRRNSAVPEP